jgi:hypothetical protein
MHLNVVIVNSEKQIFSVNSLTHQIFYRRLILALASKGSCQKSNSVSIAIPQPNNPGPYYVGTDGRTG